MPPCALLLLDLDGTLIDSIELIVRSFQHAGAAILGRALTRGEIVPTIGRPLVDVCAAMAPGRGPEMIAVYREWNHAHHDEYVTVYPGVFDMIRAVRERGVPLGIVSSKARVAAQPTFDRFGLDDGMATVILHDDTPRHKPLPDPLLVAAERVGVSPAACWYLGDSTHDMEAARAAGMIAVGAAWGPYPVSKITALAHVIAATPMDVIALLDATNGTNGTTPSRD